MQILIEIGYSDTGYFSSYMTTARSDMDGGDWWLALGIGGQKLPRRIF